jgi:hypothetical protein
VDLNFTLEWTFMMSSSVEEVDSVEPAELKTEVGFCVNIHLSHEVAQYVVFRTFDPHGKTRLRQAKVLEKALDLSDLVAFTFVWRIPRLRLPKPGEHRTNGD